MTIKYITTAFAYEEGGDFFAKLRAAFFKNELFQGVRTSAILREKENIFSA